MTNDFNNTENENRFVYVEEDCKTHIDRWIDYDNGLHEIASLKDACDLLNELNNENTHIKTTIKNMMESERTTLGKSVLKQVWEAIQ